MQAILYSRSMSPITVVELTSMQWQTLEQGGSCALTPDEPMSRLHPFNVGSTGAAVRPISLKLRPLGTPAQDELLFLFTEVEDDEELAANLKLALLPAQLKWLQRRGVAIPG